MNKLFWLKFAMNTLCYSYRRWSFLSAIVSYIKDDLKCHIKFSFSVLSFFLNCGKRLLKSLSHSDSAVLFNFWKLISTSRGKQLEFSNSNEKFLHSFVNGFAYSTTGFCNLPTILVRVYACQKTHLKFTLTP